MDTRMNTETVWLQDLIKYLPSIKYMYTFKLFLKFDFQFLSYPILCYTNNNKKELYLLLQSKYRWYYKFFLYSNICFSAKNIMTEKNWTPEFR